MVFQTSMIMFHVKFQGCTCRLACPWHIPIRIQAPRNPRKIRRMDWWSKSHQGGHRSCRFYKIPFLGHRNGSLGGGYIPYIKDSLLKVPEKKPNSDVNFHQLEIPKPVDGKHTVDGSEFRLTSYQLRLVVEIPLFTRFYIYQVVGLGISSINSRTLGDWISFWMASWHVVSQHKDSNGPTSPQWGHNPPQEIMQTAPGKSAKMWPFWDGEFTWWVDDLQRIGDEKMIRWWSSVTAAEPPGYEGIIKFGGRPLDPPHDIWGVDHTHRDRASGLVLYKALVSGFAKQISTKKRKLTVDWLQKQQWMKMYLLSKLVVFHSHVSFRCVTILSPSWRSLNPFNKGHVNSPSPKRSRLESQSFWIFVEITTCFC